MWVDMMPECPRNSDKNDSGPRGLGKNYWGSKQTSALYRHKSILCLSDDEDTPVHPTVIV